MKLAAFLILILWTASVANGQNPDSSARLIFLPRGLLFSPLRANIQEPRIGVFKFLDAEKMNVAIGNTIDVVSVKFPDFEVAAGLDFFGYAFVTGVQGLRLQIDAVDGFFGGNASFSKTIDNRILQGRLRILHHSAHFVDGHYLSATNSWIDNQRPIPYTRDFGEFIGAYIFPAHEDILARTYGGISFATLVRPVAIQRFAYLAGIEIYETSHRFLEQPANLFIAYNISLTGAPAFAATHQAQLGVKLGAWDRKGPSLYLAYYAGSHMFGEYFGKRITTIGAGFTMDFF